MGIRERFLPEEDGLAGDRAYAQRARRLGLPFEAQPKGRAFLPVERKAEGIEAFAAGIRVGRVAFLRQPTGVRLAIAPRAAEIERIAEKLEGFDDIRARLTVTTPAAIRRLLTEAAAQPLLDHALGDLATRHPEFSARRLLSAGQSVAIALCALLLAIALWLFGWKAIAALNLMFGLLFLALIMLRTLAISVVLDRMLRPPPPLAIDPAALPIYSILVPLYDEAHMVPELVRALARLDWPRERLDIKLVLEARDRATRRAAEALRLEPPFEIVIVPDRSPRTKPKALAFALPLARGDFVTVYDAEDRPDPGQLREAYAAFMAGGDDLACVQAPLLIDNAGLNGLTALFAMEYSIQFDGLLPTLAAFSMPLPLGGTSNHFRRSALVAAGGWDPYNVTEDADLGVRLARFGYRTSTIAAPTYEEAPRSSRLWLKQRTRWLKGWMQTWLVHTRQPRRLWREIGGRRVLGFTLTSLGSIVAAAVHPLYLASAVLLLVDPSVLWRANSPIMAAALALSLFNFVSAYAVFALLSAATLRMRRIRRPPGALWFLPCYWLLQSLACYRALFQLVIAPHRWEKTPHHGRRSREPAKPVQRPAAIRVRTAR
ncbi:glycosyltransferase [Kaistia dalseonensis]|uniref:Cellulose synthase/poly-beta-1,6-N-acetylglucosamine synthase-like glycosyltransferase n=1 Tax=Kaistia dalseonensis TaxID=410840 RepID=A0ABU0HET7_9HYPH|nr:glycosyltransferase family 2 protein [Kaistia dalseonensis]MCX5497828.1 glycosyltransferase [Kaistia dalseonensis]MDQ0440472.1 cellulose synthase/poly-beta-1,6-N-acetylglucosamine synthase-like glycosyltransferase [Kaistia dalseonensis]